MLSKSRELTELEVSLILGDPENRRILTLHEQEEISRLNEAVFLPLEDKHPSLKPIFQAINEHTDPVEKLEEQREAVAQVQAINYLLERMGGRIIGLKKEDLPPELKVMIQKTNTFFEKYCPFLPVQDLYYAHLSRALTAISAQEKIIVEEIAKKTEYRDKVKRYVFPSREEAEEYLRKSQEMKFDTLCTLREVADLAKKIMSPRKELPPQVEMAPTPAACEDFLSAIREYYQREFSRIYPLQ